MAHSLASLRVTQLAARILSLYGDLTVYGDRLVADLGLTRARWQVLDAVLERPATVASVARELGLTRQSVQRSADRLVDDGLATLLPNPDHRTARLLAPSSSGGRALVEVRRRHEAWAQQVAEAFAGDELATACRVLHRLEERVKLVPCS